jgi:hypothetical protein
MSTATDMRDHYLAAEAAILRDQRYRWGDRELSRADLTQVQAGRREWERRAAAEARGGGPVGVRYARQAKGRVMISINDHPDIRRVFDGLHMRELTIRYSVASRHGVPSESGELMITNYRPEVRGGLF